MIEAIAEQIKELIKDSLKGAPNDVQKSVFDSVMAQVERTGTFNPEAVADEYGKAMINAGAFSVVQNTYTEDQISTVQQLSRQEAKSLIHQMRALANLNQTLLIKELEIANHNLKVKDQQAITASKFTSLTNIGNELKSIKSMIDHYSVLIEIEESKFFKNKKALSMYEDELDELNEQYNTLRKKYKGKEKEYRESKAAEEKIKTVDPERVSQFIEKTLEKYRLNKPK